MATNLKQVADQLMADIKKKIQNGEYEVTFAGDLNCWLTVDGVEEVQVSWDGTMAIHLQVKDNGRVKDIFDHLQEEILHDRLKRTIEEKERIEQEIERRKQQAQAEQGDH